MIILIIFLGAGENSSNNNIIVERKKIMSTTYTQLINGIDHWSKLYAYLLFRIASDGIWIQKDPEFWFNAITDKTIIIKFLLTGDTGGGPLHTAKVSVKNKSTNRVLFTTILTFDHVFTNTSFSTRALEVYTYMNSYADGKSWYEKAQCQGEEGCRVPDMSLLEWNELFGPLEYVARLDNDIFSLHQDINISLPDTGFNLLSALATIPKLDITLTPTRKMKITMEMCRQWALFAILEMRRYYYGCC
jgi:hypothetical protein